MDINNIERPKIEEVQPVKKKRGRKPKSKEEKIYFGEKEEQAVMDYISATSKEEKQQIYNSLLLKPFQKMVEAIIRGYDKYIPGEEFSDTYNDALSNLITKIDKFKPEKGKKAYSYYSNICKNYLSGRLTMYSKTLVRNPSYDTLDIDIANSINYSNTTNRSKKVAEEEVKRLIMRINEMVSNDEKFGLKDSEKKLGLALANLLTNWEDVLTTDSSDKLNKSAVLFFLREQTGLDTKGIRDNLKKFKREFLIIKDFVIS